MIEHMLTTEDNPWNPFTHFKEWYAFDESAGYRSLAFLARIVKSSNELSDAYQNAAIEQGIDEIVKENILGIYLKVSSDSNALPITKTSVTLTPSG